ncbi:FAD/NAD(P)-binding protein [Couchioplanes caeruleus]|uniref:FAD/NAD(P)-binding protein n=1 Tax=Couchioplanes caeruleus TaxID=56438 RepID=UPI0008FF1355|nr:FAD/NAD(P)-binding protein [Couchioplanes caeruleus]
MPGSPDDGHSGESLPPRETQGGGDHFRLTIVGGGPRATYALERLAATVDRLGPDGRIEIRVYERTGELGADGVHSVRRARTSFLNRIRSGGRAAQAGLQQARRVVMSGKVFGIFPKGNPSAGRPAPPGKDRRHAAGPDSPARRSCRSASSARTRCRGARRQGTPGPPPR